MHTIWQDPLDMSGNNYIYVTHGFQYGNTTDNMSGLHGINTPGVSFTTKPDGRVAYKKCSRSGFICTL
jgi:hypothetical protein